ncbi:MAG: site-specific DNA-methyltransferase [Proteobacteria bacterium]|nr:site-specific DNA-methyltransferase [Pseudomonadota bacterium]
MPILQWLDRDKTIKQTSRVPYRLLEADQNLSYGDQNSQNLLIQGDNLEALKALLPYYAGKVKCVYIDPPYNTGSAFQHYDDNLEHTKWLEMIYPRLELLREFLSEDGSIWISIDADESHYLKVVCDEIFGRKNFIDEIVWQRSYSPINLKKTLSRSHDTILVYAKNSNGFELNKLPRSDEANSRYKNPDNDPRGVWKSSDLSVGPAVEKNIYEIETPSGKKVFPPNGRSWVLGKERFQEFLEGNRIWFGPNGSSVPSIKRFLHEVKDGVTAMTWWPYQEVGHNQDAKKEIKDLNLGEVFGTPKSEKLVYRILTLSTDEGDLVLDSFLGSGTTAAVAHKMNRQWIGIEMGEHAKTHCAARLQKVIDGEQGGISKDSNWQGGGGFRFYNLGEAIFDEDGQINKNIRFEHLAAHIWFSETKTPFSQKEKSPLLGIHNGIAYYLLFNGILGDKSISGGNVLTSKTLSALLNFNGPKVIYGETSRLGLSKLEDNQITFKQTPYDIKAR